MALAGGMRDKSGPGYHSEIQRVVINLFGASSFADPIFLHCGGVGYIKCEFHIGLTELRRRRFVFDRMVPKSTRMLAFERAFREHMNI
jgi:hypothetical protein